jgi:GTP cyclohydrolase I
MHYYEVCNMVFSRKYARIALHDAAMQFEPKPAAVLVSTEQACASTRGNAKQHCKTDLYVLIVQTQRRVTFMSISSP